MRIGEEQWVSEYLDRYGVEPGVAAQQEQVFAGNISTASRLLPYLVVESKERNRSAMINLQTQNGSGARQQTRKANMNVYNAVDLGHGMKVALVMVTPAIAEEWLACNHPKNRNIVGSRVDSYASDMSSGYWRLTHQGVAFDKEGFNIDGQHRLRAVIESGVPTLMLVVWNDNATLNDPIDRNRGRTIAWITGRGNRATSSLRSLRDLEAGGEVRSTFTVGEADDIYGRHAEWYDLIGSGLNLEKIPGGATAALIWAAPADPDKVRVFAEKIISGEMIDGKNPAFAWRTWRDRNNKSAKPIEFAYATLNCIRHFVGGQTLEKVYVGEMGYRAFTARRRMLHIPNTPGAEVVPAVPYAPPK